MVVFNHQWDINLKDSAFGMIKWKQSAMGFTNFGLDYSNPNFCKYAESYGANGYKLQPEDDLHAVLKELGERLCLLD